MAFKCKSVNISYSHMKFLGELGRAEDCFTLGYFGDCGEVSKFSKSKGKNSFTWWLARKWPTKLIRCMILSLLSPYHPCLVDVTNHIDRTRTKGFYIPW